MGIWDLIPATGLPPFSCQPSPSKHSVLLLVFNLCLCCSLIRGALSCPECPNSSFTHSLGSPSGVALPFYSHTAVKLDSSPWAVVPIHVPVCPSPRMGCELFRSRDRVLFILVTSAVPSWGRATVPAQEAGIGKGGRRKVPVVSLELSCPTW